MTNAPLTNGDFGTWPRGFSRRAKFAWPLVRAGNLVTLNYGKALLEQDRSLGSVPVYGTNGQCGWHNASLANGPGLVLGRKGMGNLGVEWCSTPYWVIDTAYFVTPNREDVDLRFFYYLVKYIGLNHLKEGTSNPSLSRETFYAQRLPHPPLDDQQQIANVLSVLDDNIESNARMNVTLEELVRTLFNSWFVNFDVVRAKAEHRRLKGSASNDTAIFPNRFERSALGDIPRGWTVCSVADLLSLSKGSLRPEDYADEVFDHYSIPAFDDRRLPKPERGDEIKSNKLVVSEGAVLLSKLNPRIPRVWLPAANGANRPVCSTEFLVLLPKPPCTREYLYSLVSSPSFLDAFATMVTGTSGSHQRVKPEYLLEMAVILPGGDAISRFTVLCGPWLAQIATNREQSATLATVRDALLPRLLSGELRVNDTTTVPSI